MPKFSTVLLALLLAACCATATAQSGPAATFTVYADSLHRLDAPVTAPAPGTAAAYRLTETTDGSARPVAVQVADGRLTWILDGETPPGTARTYELYTDGSPSASSELTVEDAAGGVHFRLGDTDVLTWQYARATVPEGVDSIYARGGYVHPLRSPRGGTLTRIQPPDHYHHYGLWNPWTHTEFRGREIDFWNLVRGQGTVDSRGVRNVEGGAVFGRVTADLTYLAFRDSAVTDDPTEVLDETVDLRVYPPAADAAGYLVDFSNRQRNVTEDSFVVKAYRYQGFGLRATGEWDDDNVHLLTSAGYGKADGNATRARWMDVRGPTEAGEAGVLMMAHPDNYNSPEQIRIWPTGSNGGVESVFLNFNPAQDRDYRMRPGGTYALKYRLYVYDGALDTTAANRYWQDFAYPPRVVRTDVADPLAGKQVLVYTRNGEGYVHDNIPASVAAIEELGAQHGFRVTASDDPATFTAGGLEDYDVVVFSNTNNDVFDTPEQHAAFRAYVAGGGGFVGIHSACGSERDWPWFAETLGGRFFRHPERQDFDVVVLDADHPSTDFLPETWHIVADECYYMKQLNPGNHVLLAADLGTVADPEGKATYPGDTFGGLFPTAWYRTDYGGRQWYTSLGHRSEHYSDPLFRRHLLGGIEWAAH
ncbi:ThuA domain-containing protein [Lewinella sp. IMCC34183]|uniref:ThuA domain-containing protein n=1 Tax=Lewinella sp. IMCC34183 TaxID=2248762 RepID=UPI0018E56482|nr:ThuA domain-containing protein [Lewinella sp. IMCC34183]